MTIRRPFSKPVLREIVNRATDEYGRIRCEGCGLYLNGKPYEIDHIIAEALVPEWKKGQKLTARDGRLLGKECCHDPKTRKHDIPKAAKTVRIQDKARGIRTQKAKIPSRPFPKRERKEKPSLPPKRLFV